MPDQVFIFRGSSSFADRGSISQDMVEDLQLVADLSKEQVAGLRNDLEQVKGFLDPEALAEVVGNVIQDEATADAIGRTLRKLSRLDIEHLLKSFVEIQEEDKKFPLKPDAIEKLGVILSDLLGYIPALQRFKKAERLATLTGQPLESIDLICDMRPIFDDSREKIEGVVPYTRMRLTVTGENGLPLSFEAELSAQQVHDLSEKATKAMQKLAAIQATIEGWLPNGTPDLPMTRIPRKDSSDA